MSQILLLSLLQKNYRTLQNRSFLKTFLNEHTWTFDSLLGHLSLHEDLFIKNVWNHAPTRKEEATSLTHLSHQGVRFTHPQDLYYPASFVGMPGAPFFMSYMGHPCWTSENSIAVVGSREASQLSRLWMEDCFASFLTSSRPVVVSGGARGIDQMAHQLAIRNRCATMILLPSGLGNLYPSSLEGWRSKVIDGGGCLLSEYPYSQGMLKHFFQDRNRLIAGLGVMTLLVEAKRRSGSLLTAHKTLELGKTVLVVPGHPSDLSHLGNIDLLSEGATPVRDAEDLHRYFLSELRSAPRAAPRSSQISLFEN